LSCILKIVFQCGTGVSGNFRQNLWRNFLYQLYLAQGFDTHTHTHTPHRIYTSLIGTSQHHRWEVWNEPKKGLLFKENDSSGSYIIGKIFRYFAVSQFRFEPGSLKIQV
jgi:hypothetical protein